MATIHVRDVPEDVYARIRSLARTEGRSMNAQVVRLLSATAHDVTTTLTVEQALAEARRIRLSHGGRRRPTGLATLREGRRSRERR